MLEKKDYSLIPDLVNNLNSPIARQFIAMVTWNCIFESFYLLLQIFWYKPIER
jgi:hypothetical protein